MSKREYVNIGEERLGKDAVYMLDSTKCREELGWQDKISLEQSFADCISWVDKYFEELNNELHDNIHKP